MTGFKAGLLIVLLSLCSLMYIKSTEADEIHKDIQLCSTVSELSATIQEDRQKFGMTLHEYFAAIEAEVEEIDWRLPWIKAIAVTVYNRHSITQHPNDVKGIEFERCINKRGHELES